jgi:hypothetical protein
MKLFFNFVMSSFRFQNSTPKYCYFHIKIQGKKDIFFSLHMHIYTQKIKIKGLHRKIIIIIITTLHILQVSY